MTTAKTISLFIFAVLILVSCDPAKIVVIKASNKNNTSVMIFGNGRMLPFANRADSNKIVIQVPLNDTTKRTLKYGLGDWYEGAITDLAKNIDSIIISNAQGRSVLNNRTDIETYLKKHRGGYAKNILRIEAK